MDTVVQGRTTKLVNARVHAAALANSAIKCFWASKLPFQVSYHKRARLDLS